MAVYPATLPQNFQVDTYRETGADNLIRTSMDVGPAKVRRRTTANVRLLRGTLWLTAAQYTIFRDFFENTLAYGSITFTKDDQHGTNRTWRFVSPPVYTANGPTEWQVSVEWEELP